MKILIAGGGIGGLTTALACQHLGMAYELFEAAPEIREVGAGIWVPPNAMQVMQRLGLSDAIKQEGTTLDSISVGGPSGKKWFTFPSAKAISKYGFATVAIHRARLQSLLVHALSKENIHTGKRLKKFEQRKNEVILYFEDGSEVSGNCLVGADGLRSVVRQQLLGNIPLRYSGQTCWRGIVNLRLPSEIRGEMIELWGKSPGQRFAYSHISQDEVYYYATLATPSGGKNDTDIKTFLHKHYDSFGPHAATIIDAIDVRHLIRTDLFDLSPIHQWTFDHVALLGDAAHATTPNLGQGAAQAMEDAYVLTKALKENMNDITLAFKIYQHKRMKKAHYIVNASWRLGQITNFKNRTAIALRNWLIRTAPDFVTEKQIDKAYRIDF